MMRFCLVFLAHLVVGVAQASAGGVRASVFPDYEGIVKRWLALAQKGNVDAQNNLAAMYEMGLGVQQDVLEAVKWYRLAAGRGDGFAQYKLGTMYKFGLGVPQDHAEAAKWLGMAASRGDAFAVYQLGDLYETGVGVPGDRILAHALFSLAADRLPGDLEVRRRRDEAASNLSRQEIATARALARKLARPGGFAKALDERLREKR